MTKRVPALDFNRNNSTSVRDLRANFCRARDRFATDVENDVGDLEAVIGGYAARVDRRNDHAAVRLVAGRQGEAELRHVSIGNLRFAACVSFGSVPSVSVTVFS